MSKRTNAKRSFRRKQNAANREYLKIQQTEIFVTELFKETIDEKIVPLTRKGRKPTPRGVKRGYTPPWKTRFDNGLVILTGYHRSDSKPVRDGFIWSMSLKRWVKKES